MRIVVAGGTGFIGRPFCDALASGGHEGVVLSRGAAAVVPRDVWPGRAGVRRAFWTGTEDTTTWAHLIDGADAIVNLAGESSASGRWTAARKRRLESSRLEPTRALGMAIQQATSPPQALLSASAIGYYGSRGDQRLTESSVPGDDFLARLCVSWEQDARRAAGSRTRCVLLRTGIVLGADGGALAPMLMQFRMFAGGPVGSGRQFMSWIHRDDWVALVMALIDSPGVDGPVNATSPAPVTNAEFARTLGRALGRPSLLRTPGFALKIAVGEMAGPLLLSSQRVLHSNNTIWVILALLFSEGDSTAPLAWPLAVAWTPGAMQPASGRCLVYAMATHACQATGLSPWKTRCIRVSHNSLKLGFLSWRAVLPELLKKRFLFNYKSCSHLHGPRKRVKGDCPASLAVTTQLKTTRLNKECSVKSQMLSRRDFLKLAGVAAGGLVLASCGGSGSGGNQLRIMVDSWALAYAPFKEMAKTYNELHPEAPVKVRSKPGRLDDQGRWYSSRVAIGPPER